jgi:hypothetical protein
MVAHDEVTMRLTQVLGDAAAATLRRVLERLIPADDWPDGWQAGCGAYLAQQLDGDLADWVPRYRAGLAALDAEAQLRHQRAFVDLAPDAADALLHDVEHGTVRAEWPIDAAAFFAGAVDHAAEGFYSDPANGGNRGGIAWQMLGFVVTG